MNSAAFSSRSHGAGNSFQPIRRGASTGGGSASARRARSSLVLLIAAVGIVFAFFIFSVAITARDDIAPSHGADKRGPRGSNGLGSSSKKKHHKVEMTLIGGRRGGLGPRGDAEEEQHSSALRGGRRTQRPRKDVAAPSNLPMHNGPSIVEPSTKESTSSEIPPVTMAETPTFDEQSLLPSPTTPTSTTSTSSRPLYSSYECFGMRSEDPTGHGNLNVMGHALAPNHACLVRNACVRAHVLTIVVPSIAAVVNQTSGGRPLARGPPTLFFPHVGTSASSTFSSPLPE